MCSDFVLSRMDEYLRWLETEEEFVALDRQIDAGLTATTCPSCGIAVIDSEKVVHACSLCMSDVPAVPLEVRLAMPKPLW